MTWNKKSKKWQAKYKKVYLGLQETVEEAAAAVDKYEADGIKPPPAVVAEKSSDDRGVQWDKAAKKWEASVRNNFRQRCTTQNTPGRRSSCGA